MMLDCETEDSAYHSLGQILDMDRDSIQAKLDDFARPEVTIPDDSNPWKYIVEFFEASEVCKERHTSTCWFHGTRTHEPESFRNGIYPLPQRLDAMWNYLYSLVSDQIPARAWKEFRQDTEQNDYGLGECWRAKLREGGPCGFFLRDKLLRSDGHNYLIIPEAVEDLLACFRHYRPKINLKEIYWRATMPYVIKFRSNAVSSWHVGAALSYLYTLRREIPTKSNHWPHFVGDGTPVPPADVLSITSLVQISEAQQAKFQREMEPKLRELGIFTGW